MIPQNKNVCQLVWHYLDTAVEGSELYCYNTESDRNSVVSQASCRMDMTWLEQNSHMVKLVVFDNYHVVGSRMWSLNGITLKVYEYTYEYGIFKITRTCHNFWQIINTSSTMLSFTIYFFFKIRIIHTTKST